MNGYIYIYIHNTELVQSPHISIMLGLAAARPLDDWTRDYEVTDGS